MAALCCAKLSCSNAYGLSTVPSLRRQFIAQSAASLAVVGIAPSVVLAKEDCMKDCVSNCTRVAPGSADYCRQSCSEYCSQTDRTDGLSGSVSGEGGEGMIQVTLEASSPVDESSKLYLIWNDVACRSFR